MFLPNTKWLTINAQIKQLNMKKLFSLQKVSDSPTKINKEIGLSKWKIKFKNAIHTCKSELLALVHLLCSRLSFFQKSNCYPTESELEKANRGHYHRI